MQTLGKQIGVFAACGALKIARSVYYRVARRASSAPDVPGGISAAVDGASTESASTESASTEGASTEGASTEGASTEGASTEGSLLRTSARRHPRGLSDEEKQRILEVCSSERYIDCSASHIVAALLDEGRYLASERTFYRVLGENAPIQERRNQRRHPRYAAPELLATTVKQVWSWDITKLKGPIAGRWYHLYVMIDIYSRYVVGWAVFECESKQLATKFIDQTCDRQGVRSGQLTIHADRGPAMRSREVAELLARLEIRRSHSRPYCSNDNPYSESQFKTMKYSPGFPQRFGSIEDAREFCRTFFDWYNNEHRHSGIAMLTPSMVHDGRAEAVLSDRNAVLADAYRSHPERFVGGVPRAGRLPEGVWINRPVNHAEAFPEVEADIERRRSDEPQPVVNRPQPERRHGGGVPIGGSDPLSTTVDTRQEVPALGA